MTLRTVHLFIFDTLADWETGYAIAGLNSPQLGERRYRVVTVGAGADPVTTMGGLRILPDMRLDELTPEQSAMLILPGGGSWDQGGNTDAVLKGKEFLENGVPVAAICGATGGLARLGLLDDRPHTSNALAYLRAYAPDYRGAEHYREELSVSDGDLITASGAGAVEFARDIFRKLDVYDDRAIDAWYGLFKTGDPEYFAALVEIEESLAR